MHARLALSNNGLTLSEPGLQTTSLESHYLRMMPVRRLWTLRRMFYQNSLSQVSVIIEGDQVNFGHITCLERVSGTMSGMAQEQQPCEQQYTALFISDCCNVPYIIIM